MADLSVADQCDIILKAEEVWADSQGQTDMYTADAETIKALAERQVGRTRIITELENPELEANTVKIVWLDNCGQVLDDACQDVCDLEATEIAMNSKTVNLNKCASASFKVNENDLLRNRYSLDEIVARKMLSITKALDEEINAKSLLFLTANVGLNKNPETYAKVGETLQIPAADYDTDLYLKFMIDSKLNKLSDAFVVDNGALYRYYMNAQLNANNLDGSGDFKRSQLMKTYFDFTGFAQAPVTAQDTFLISSSAYAFASRNYNSSAPTEVNPKGGRQVRWSVASNTIPGIRYDVYHEYVCTGKRFTHTYYVEANYDFVLNPIGCDFEVTPAGPDDTPPAVVGNVTGILGYNKIA